MRRSSDTARAVLCLAPAVFWTLALFGVGAVPVGPSLPGLSWGDKSLHAIAFGLYVPWLALADHYLRPAGAWPARFLYCAATSSAVGMLLEIWQLLWPSRTFEMLDWVADTAGAAIALGVLLAIHAAPSRPALGAAPERIPPGA